MMKQMTKQLAGECVIAMIAAMKRTLTKNGLKIKPKYEDQIRLMLLTKLNRG